MVLMLLNQNQTLTSNRNTENDLLYDQTNRHVYSTLYIWIGRWKENH